MTKEEFEKIKATRLDIASRKRDSGSFETIQFADAREIDYLLEQIKGVSFDGIDEKITKAIAALDQKCIEARVQLDEKFLRANTELKQELTETINRLDTNYEKKTNDLDNKIRSIPKLPIGSMVQFTGTTIPDGWAYCDGSEMTDSKFTELKKIIGAQFNNKLPDLDNYIINYK